jgi:hypothetical protein
MLRSGLGGLLLVAFVGCTDPGLDEMGSGPAETVTWEALDELETGEGGLMGVGYAIDQDDWSGAQDLLKSPEYEAAISKFEQAALPSEWSGRTAAKDKAVTQLKALAEAAKAGADQDKLKSAWESVNAALGELRGSSGTSGG